MQEDYTKHKALFFSALTAVSTSERKNYRQAATIPMKEVLHGKPFEFETRAPSWVSAGNARPEGRCSRWEPKSTIGPQTGHREKGKTEAHPRNMYYTHPELL